MAFTFQGFIKLREAFDALPPAGRIFTKPRIDRTTIMDAEYVVIPSRAVDGYKDEKGGRIPNVLAGKGYFEWLEAPMFREIILDRVERDAQAPIADIVDAVFYYVEFDTFKDAD